MQRRRCLSAVEDNLNLDSDYGFDEPANCCWSDEDNDVRYECNAPIVAALDDDSLPWEEQMAVFRGMVEGLKKFDASGKFCGPLPREKMLLLLYIHNPGDDTGRWTCEWAAETNPPNVAQWFVEEYPY